MDVPRKYAYFSMEIGFHPAVPTYSGGLGVLAGDTVRSAADMHVPMVAVTPVHRKGYFRQEIDVDGNQFEKPSLWRVEDHAHLMPPVVCVQIEARNVLVRAWKHIVQGVSGANVPIYLLDTDIAENHADDRMLTDHLYGGDQRYRLAQEAVIGIGGVRMLRALGYRNLEVFHMNEGHAALLTVELLNERVAARGETSPSVDDIAAVRRMCVFTTHTPVPAGHDQFPVALVDQMLGRMDTLRSHATTFRDGHLNMTYLALNLSRYVNAVARKHGEVSRTMFPEHHVDSITNGVHATTWACDAMAALFDSNMPGWRQDNYILRHALFLPHDRIWDAHMQAKGALVDFANRTMNADMHPNAFTIGFARRAATYKRADLLVSEIETLKAMARRHGPMQIIYAGKAHPRDGGGKDLIKRVHAALRALQPEVKAVYLPNYEMDLGRVITSGVDLWVNTPQRPLEASGTSGMKAALNGVPSLSVPDGWWIEGCIEGVTGWAINGEHFEGDPADEYAWDAKNLYAKLNDVILPMWHTDRERYGGIMRHAIAINGVYFNTQRMVQEYVVRAYSGG
jgi:glycogen phosphorylase